MGKHEIVILQDGLSDHPAVIAWRRLEPGSSAPSSVEVLKPPKRKSAAFRLNGVANGGGSIVAKRRERSGLDLERLCFTEVLPSVSLPSLAVYGVVEAEEDQSWIFLEDAGERWYDKKRADHLGLAVHWLADLHTRSSDWVALMPDTGPRYFRAVADDAILGLRNSLEHPALSAEDASVLCAAASHIEAARMDWDRIEAVCGLTPQALVHGDFVPKNVRVRDGREGPELVVFDWETAGAASPAADLGLLPEDGEPLRRYHELVRSVWPHLSRCDVQELARVGYLLRLLHSVQWELRSFRYAWIERALRKMRSYESALREAVEPRVRLQR